MQADIAKFASKAYKLATCARMIYSCFYNAISAARQWMM